MVVKLTVTVYEKLQTFSGDYSGCSRKEVCNSYIWRQTKNCIKLEVNWGRLIRSLSSQSGTPELSGVLVLSHCLQSLEFADALSSGPTLLLLCYVIKLPASAILGQHLAYLKMHPKCSSVVTLEYG